MADKKISALTAATTPLAGTEVLPIVQSGSTVKVSAADVTAGRAVSMASGTLSSGNLSFSGTAQRITGEMSTATVANRVMFQTSTVNSATNVHSIPNGTSAISGMNSFNNSDPTNASLVGFVITASEGRFQSAQTGTGTYLPMTFFTNGAERARIDTAGDITFKTGNLIQGTAAKGINFTANTPAAGMTSQLLNWYEEGTWTPTLSGSGTAGTYQLATASGWYTRVGRSITVIFNVQLAAVVTGGGTGFAVLGGLPFNTATTNAAAGAVTLGGVNYTAGTNYVTVMPRSTGSSQLIFEEVNINGAVNDMAISAFGVNDTIKGTLTYIV